MNRDKILYLECYSGISGDMTVAALLDLGADQQILQDSLQQLDVDGYEIKIGRTKKCGIDACSFDVILSEEQEHGHTHESSHGNSHRHEHSHDHHGHSHAHTHVHRKMKDIMEIIDQSALNSNVKKLTKEMFGAVARAEAKAHNLPEEEVHFHEVGAVDSIVDIVAAAVCIDNLGVKRVAVSDLYEGSGHVRCQHGIIPVPVPAVINIASEYALILRQSDNQGEMVTPTGAAIAAVLRTEEKLPERYTICRTGIGAGKKGFKRANILRAMLIKDADKKEEDIWMIESNIDDSCGEALGLVMETLMENGARDVHYIPVFMKKNRPAYQIRILCDREKAVVMEDILFAQTTTIGIRKYPVTRRILDRQSVILETSYGQAAMKVCEFNGRKRCYPEYESVREIMARTGESYMSIYGKLIAEAEAQIIGEK